MGRAVKGHVLDEVRETLLVIVFENRSGFHNKPKFCPLLGLLVGPNVISKPIGQPSDCDLPLDRYWIGERRRHLRRGSGQTSDGQED